MFGIKIEEVSKGQIIIKSGEKLTHVYLVIDGEFNVERHFVFQKSKIACLNDSKIRSAHIDYQKTNNVRKV